MVFGLQISLVEVDFLDMKLSADSGVLRNEVSSCVPLRDIGFADVRVAYHHDLEHIIERVKLLVGVFCLWK